ncbi:MAG: hypothetical protein ACI8R4_000237 [Paracoccaceae bacterium]|jgi:hypothetical protein
MAAKVIFHLPSQAVENYETKGYLAIFPAIKHLIEARGGTTMAVQRGKTLRNPFITDWSDLIDPENLHIVENGCVRAPNVFNTTLAYVPPYWHLDQQGVLYNSSAAARAYDPKTVRYWPANRFLDDMRTRLVDTRKSRYKQLKQVTEIPQGAIAVFLQGDLPSRQGSAHCSTEDMLRAVVAGAGGRPVVVKAHPNTKQIKDAKMVLGLMLEGLVLIPSDANVHDILAKCAVTVSFNSAVSVEGFMHQKPAILFGKSDFHHICETVTTPGDFAAALDRALQKKGGYAKYLYWYFTTNCIAADAPDFADQVLAKFATAGFGAARLGLRPSSGDG